MPSSPPAVSDQDRATLESWSRSSTVSAGQRERALIVLSVADGAGVSGTARTLGVSRPTVMKWRERFGVDGVEGLADRPRSGRPKTVDDADHRRDAGRAAGVRDRAGHRPLLRAARHGRVSRLPQTRREGYPRRRLRVVLDNPHTHKHDDLNQWLATNPQIILQFTPPWGSRLNLVEAFFEIITPPSHPPWILDTSHNSPQPSARSSPPTTTAPSRSPGPKTADDLLIRATRQRASDAEH